MKKEVTTRAVVVGARAAGEGSMRVSLYTEELGLVSAFVQSAREERSKLRAHLTLGTSGTYTLVRGREVWRLIGAVRTQNVFYSSDSAVGEAAARTLALIQQFIHGEGENRALFESLFEYVRALPVLSADDARVAEYVVALRILAALGYVAPSADTHDLLGAEYTAALLAIAHDRRTALLARINEGLIESGL